VPSYRIDAPFVEVSLGAIYTSTELRRLFESIRDDPAVPDEALLLFDTTARTEVIATADIRERLDVLVDTLRPRIAPVFAIIVSSATALMAQTAQREARAKGFRVGLFLDVESARRWLAGFGSSPEGP
jgi:hypothetical protein